LVLARVWQDGAWAAPALDAELARSGVDAREARLATELVYGVLRTSGWLDARIAAHAKNDRWRKKPEIRAHLSMAAYSLSFLERVPGFAAVDEAVEAIRRIGGAPVAGFANAVLRKLARAPSRREELPAAIESSLPRWLRDALDASLGEGGARAFVHSVAPPPVGICLRAGAARESWIERLQQTATQATIEPGRVSPRAILVRGAGDVKRLPGANQDWIVQEEGAQAVALLVGAREGDAVLDACAGRGQKSLLLGEAVGESGAIDAADLHPSKLARLAVSPAGSLVRSRFAVDWTRGSGDVSARYQRVLVDAPCTGVGTLRRRPEIAARLAAADPARLAAVQLHIARGAAQHVESGGRFVYAVCSVLRDEAEGVASALLEPHEGLRLEAAPFDAPLAAALGAGEAPQLRLLPQIHGTDGYFVASFVAHRQ
jgi:16S rRNA (cytosine967-C5)-methyltransferase